MTLLVAAPAFGAPQANLGVTAGGAATDVRTNGPRGAFHLGVRGDVLFMRTRDRGMGLGPYGEIATAAFDTLEVGAGVAWLLPVSESLPFVFSAGMFERRTRAFDWEPGIATSLFVGSRSYNFTSWYGPAIGLFLQGRYGFGDGKQGDIIGGAQLDLSFLAYPFILAYWALRR